MLRYSLIAPVASCSSSSGIYRPPLFLSILITMTSSRKRIHRARPQRLLRWPDLEVSLISTPSLVNVQIFHCRGRRRVRSINFNAHLSHLWPTKFPFSSSRPRRFEGLYQGVAAEDRNAPLYALCPKYELLDRPGALHLCRHDLEFLFYMVLILATLRHSTSNGRGGWSAVYATGIQRVTS